MADKGKFITFEGGEGSGKSTQIEKLAARLTKLGHAVLVTREPGGTDVGEQIRDVLQYSQRSVRMTAEAELLLFCASRAQLVRELIQPALAEGRIVLCDRFHDSTAVYQGVGRRLDVRQVDPIIRFAIGGCVPDLTIVLDLEPQAGRERTRGRELFDRMENQALEFYERVRQGYRDLARREPRRVQLVDASLGRLELEEKIWKLVEPIIERKRHG